LHETPNEFFRIGLEDLVDLVEEIVEFGFELFALIGNTGRLVDFDGWRLRRSLSDLLSFSHGPSLRFLPLPLQQRKQEMWIVAIPDCGTGLRAERFKQFSR